MSGIILPRRFKNQPQYAAPIDRNGLGKGIQLLFNPAAGPVDLATGRLWAPGGNASIAAERKGKVFSLDGVGDYYGYTGYPEITSNVGTFFIWMPRVGAKDDFGHVYLGASSPAVCGHQIDNDGKIYIATGSGASSGNLSGWFNSTNRSLILVSNGTAAGTKAFVDGKDTGFTWATPPTAWGAGDKNFNLGRYSSGSGVHDFSGTILAAGLTSAVWGVSEARAFHQNPWQLFKAPARRLWVVSSATGDTTGSSSGTAIVSGVGASVAESTGSSSGVATVSGAGDSTSDSGSTGSASGSSTVNGVGASTAASSGSVNGVASVSGVGSSASSTATGSSSGSATVIGVGASTGGVQAFSGGYPYVSREDHAERRKKERVKLGIVGEEKPKAVDTPKQLKNNRLDKKTPVVVDTKELAEQEAFNAELKHLLQLELEREEEAIIRLLMDM